jgi:hypothetical protein
VRPEPGGSSFCSSHMKAVSVLALAAIGVAGVVEAQTTGPYPAGPRPPPPGGARSVSLTASQILSARSCGQARAGKGKKTRPSVRTGGSWSDNQDDQYVGAM